MAKIKILKCKSCDDGFVTYPAVLMNDHSTLAAKTDICLVCEGGGEVTIGKKKMDPLVARFWALKTPDEVRAAAQGL